MHIDILKPLLIGGGIGAFFAFLKLPIPAPDSVGSMLGVIGLFAGYFLITKFFIG